MTQEEQKAYTLVCGASSGFGNAVAQTLLERLEPVLGVARREEKLSRMKKQYENFEFIAGDLTQESTIDRIADFFKEHPVKAAFINSGGPPAAAFLETKLADWDKAYEDILRWKVKLALLISNSMKKQGYGRVVFLESASVKQPIPNLVLSTSLRMAVVGMAKTMADELAEDRITVNVLAPGSHDTSALERLYVKAAEKQNISLEQAKKQFKQKTGMNRLGDPMELASLASWLLSEDAGFVTGQTITAAGAAVKGVFG